MIYRIFELDGNRPEAGLPAYVPTQQEALDIAERAVVTSVQPLYVVVVNDYAVMHSITREDHAAALHAKQVMPHIQF